MKAGILLSVREKATRFPGKVLKPLGSAPTVTAFLLRRLRTSKRAAEVVLATSTDPRDEILCRIAIEEDCYPFKGSEDDKMLRYRDAAHARGLDCVVVVDGDDPFISVEHIDRIIDYFAADPLADYVIVDQLALGATGFGLRTSALERVCDGRPEANTEVWGDLFMKNPAFACRKLEEPRLDWRWPDIRMTLDYPEDYAFFTAVADGLAAEGKGTGYGEIIAWLEAHPEVIAINRGVQEAYEAHLNRSRGELPVS